MKLNRHRSWLIVWGGILIVLFAIWFTGRFRLVAVISPIKVDYGMCISCHSGIISIGGSPSLTQFQFVNIPSRQPRWQWRFSYDSLPEFKEFSMGIPLWIAAILPALMLARAHHKNLESLTGI